MSAGVILDGLSRRVCRAYGKMLAVVQARKMTRAGLTEIAAELEDVARMLRGLIAAPRPAPKAEQQDCAGALLGEV